MALPLSYTIVLVLPDGVAKDSTQAVYDAFDRRSGEEGFPERAAAFTRAAESIGAVRDLVGLPGNDLATSPVAEELLALGAFRADVSGAGPAVYGLFLDADDARRAQEALRPRGRTILTHPV
jgi:4-diphosphocytidyl-2C-methyl-D-erythritol kinase